MIVGTEWLIEAFDCDAELLRDAATLQTVFNRVIAELDLKTVGAPLWHKFAAPGAGVTGLVMLTESHLACHTYPEFQTATFNLYCCRSRKEWNWTQNLRELLGAQNVSVTKIERGVPRRTADILSAVPSASCARAAAVERDPLKPEYNSVKVRGRGYLPHWEKEDGIYFVTFCLADSLPSAVVQSIKTEREAMQKVLNRLQRDLSATEENKLTDLFAEKVDGYLDAASGECHLKNPRIAELVARAFEHFDEKRYRLFAYCVMPNHAHAVLQTKSHYKLKEILHSWKSYTANEANKILNRSGDFWRREYYDRLIRGQAEFERTVRYVADNPIKAGLDEWRWVRVYDARMSAGCAHNSRQDVGGTTKGGGK